MAFDPDSYIKGLSARGSSDTSVSKLGGFDPDQYIKAKGLSVEPSHDLRPGVAAPEPEPDAPPEPGFFRRAWDTVKHGAHDVAEAGSDIAETRGRSLLDPSKRHALERGLSDVTTAGLGTKIAEKVGFPTTEQEPEDPRYRGAGQVGGMLLPNPFGKAGAAVAERALGPLASRATGKLAGAGVGAAKGLLGYEAGAVPQAAAGAALEGENPLEAGRRAATDPAGLLLAGGGGAVGGGARGFANEVRDPSTLSGRRLADIAAVGGKVQAFGKPATHGAFEAPEMQTGPGIGGRQKLAAESVDRVLAQNEAARQRAQDAWEQTADAIAQQHAGRKYSTTSTHGVLAALDKENDPAGTGRPLNPKISDMTDRVRQQLSTTAQVARPGAPAIPIAAADVQTFMGVRKALNQMSRHTQEPAEKHVLGQVLDAMRDDAEAIDPRFGQLNAEYRKTMQTLQQTNDSLFGRNKANFDVTDSTKQAAAQRMGRLGNDDRPGIAAEPRMQRFADARPENAREVALNRAKTAAESLRYGEPEISTNLERTMGRAAEHAVAHGAGAAVGMVAGGPVGAVIGHQVGGLARNFPQARVRLGLPLADTVSSKVNGSKAGIAVNRLTEFARQQKERERAMADRLLGR